MALILDTNALSAFADGESDALAELATAKTVAVPVIVLGDRFGIARSRRRNEYEDWLRGIAECSRILEVNATTAAYYAELRLELSRRGLPIPSNDLWIAALCRQYDMPIMSQDRHFDFIPGLKRLAW